MAELRGNERSEAEQRAYDEGYRDCAISARAMHDRDMTWRDEENVRLHKQLKGAVSLTDDQWGRVLWWLHKPVPPGPAKALDESIIRAINAQRGQ